MIARALLGLAAAALAGAAIGLPAASAQQAAARDWSKAVAVTPDGGYRMGNPAAAVKLVEYGSLTCPACARFAGQGLPQLVANYVKTGKVSFEFRNYVRDPADIAAALLSRCAAPGNYFSLTDNYFETQPQWFARIQAQASTLEGLSTQQQIARIAAIGGLDQTAAQVGVTPAKAQACLGDEKAVAKLVDMRKVAIERHQVQGTPTFLVNGVRADGALDWATLEPRLRPPGG